ncbi:hypothetical protein ASE75_14960 [Sphingomonas sp. Leaf17]|uniref:DUF262 domain-containing protein n=1 Tax=Sphingomonas sp. Leaf17 TaxID=1735683 RepID=UPI0006F54D4B|nr:DUF262 domain-containing protein [Sphingomonas sp. Leaf17]KQM66323.1 hypothetical protein ASE75_14960 [Sphingomonas sp. Leaf17]
MHAKDWKLNDVLQERQQWVIPVYQRHYAWEIRDDKQIPTLWDDLRERAEEKLDGQDIKPHFVGAIIYSQPNDQPFGTVNKRFLVDGQQRITTFNLVLCALRENARAVGCQQISNAVDEYLFNAKSGGMADPEKEQFKLWSSSFDRPYFLEIATKTADEIRAHFSQYFYKNGGIVWGSAPKLLAAYWYLQEAIAKYIDEKKSEGVEAAQVLDALLSGFLYAFQIVVVQLGKDDDAQTIFASLNGNAEPLTAFDLIRNDVFHRARLKFEDDDALYEKHWSKLETDFWKLEVKQGRLKRPRVDHLIAHSLVAESGDEIHAGQVANAYKAFSAKKQFPSVEAEIEGLLHYAHAYRQIEECDQSTPLGRYGNFSKVWDTSTFHPVALWAAAHSIPDEARNGILKLIEDYVVRRDLIGESNKNYNKVAPNMIEAMRESADPLAALQAHIGSLTAPTSRMPVHADLLDSANKLNAYGSLGSKKLRYILTRIEKDSRTHLDENIPIENLSVEHILPDRWAQNWPLPNSGAAPHENYFSAIDGGNPVSAEMREEMEIRERAKNTLGNLTLLTPPANSQNGNEGWPFKRERIAKSLLALNRNIAENDEWDEKLIRDRGEQLADAAHKVWPGLVSA